MAAAQERPLDATAERQRVSRRASHDSTAISRAGLDGNGSGSNSVARLASHRMRRSSRDSVDSMSTFKGGDGRGLSTKNAAVFGTAPRPMFTDTKAICEVSSYSGLYSSFRTSGVAGWRKPPPAPPQVPGRQAPSPGAIGLARPSSAGVLLQQNWLATRARTSASSSSSRAVEQSSFSAPPMGARRSLASTGKSATLGAARSWAPLLERLTRDQLVSLVAAKLADGRPLVTADLVDASVLPRRQAGQNGIAEGTAEGAAESVGAGVSSHSVAFLEEEEEGEAAALTEALSDGEDELGTRTVVGQTVAEGTRGGHDTGGASGTVHAHRAAARAAPPLASDE